MFPAQGAAVSGGARHRRLPRRPVHMGTGQPETFGGFGHQHDVGGKAVQRAVGIERLGHRLAIGGHVGVQKDAVAQGAHAQRGGGVVGGALRQQRETQAGRRADPRGRHASRNPRAQPVQRHQPVEIEIMGRKRREPTQHRIRIGIRRIGGCAQALQPGAKIVGRTGQPGQTALAQVPGIGVGRGGHGVVSGGYARPAVSPPWP